MRKFLAILLFTSTLTVGALCVDKNLTIFAPLVGTDNDARMQTCRDISEDRQHKVEELIRVVEDEATDENTVKGKTAAMALLAEFRAPEAVEALANQLMFLPPPGRVLNTEPVATQKFYPAVRTLIAIGEPSDACRQMLKKIIEAKHHEERDLATWVIMTILGKQEAKTRLSAIFASTPENNVQMRIRVRKSIEYIDQFKQTYDYPQETSKGTGGP